MFFSTKKSPAPPSGNVAAGSRFEIAPDARASVHAEGIVFMHLRSGVIFTANRIGARIWRGVVENRSVKAVASQISGEYGVSLERAEQDAAAFLADLKAYKFLTETEGR